VISNFCFAHIDMGKVVSRILLDTSRFDEGPSGAIALLVYG
jgi:hypothetical protein